jgi:outer membrane protein TolC
MVSVPRLAIILVQMVVLLVGRPQATTAQPARPVITLTEAVAEALLKNDRLLQHQDGLERANLAIDSARSQFSPRILPNVQGSLSRSLLNDQTYRVDFLQNFTNGSGIRAGIATSTAQIPGAPGQPDVRFYNADTTLMWTQPLLKGFGRTVARRSLTSAERQQADAIRNTRMAEQQTTVEVAQAYFRVVAQESLAKVAENGLRRARELRAASEAKLAAGRVSQLDVLRARQLVAQADLQVFDATAAVVEARERLAEVIGRDVEADFGVVSEIPAWSDDLSVETAVALAMDSRLDLKILMDAAADVADSLSYAKNQALPQFDVNLALTRRQTSRSFANSFGLDDFQFTTFFTVSLPVDRTVQTAGIRNVLIDRDARVRETDTLRRRITADVKREFRERERGRRNLVMAEELVTIAQAEVEVAQFRYERGLSNNLDVVTAETNLMNAESRRVSLLAELAVIRLSLRAAVGILDPRKDTAGPVTGSGMDDR